MTGEFDGLSDASTMLGSLPDAVRAELGELLGEIGSQALALQLALVPTRTGALARALDLSVAVDVLRLRVGLTDLKSRRDLWYAILVEYGRKAGAKIITRRARGVVSNGRRRKSSVGSYTMMARWTALPAKPFVHIDTQLENIARPMMDGFWANVKSRAGVA
jgi:hypothetical protein